MRYLLVGNYGVNNLGDETLREYFLQTFPDVDWHVVSADPGRGELDRLPLGLRSLFRPWWKTILALARSDGIVFGGGTLFTDVESLRACLLWGLHALAAVVFGKPIFLAFQGIGPFRSRWAARMTRFVCRHASFVSVRDQFSLERVSCWKLRCPIVLTFDPALQCIRRASIEQDDVLVLIPRANSQSFFFIRAQEILLHRPYTTVKLISMQPYNTNEIAFMELIRKNLGHPVVIVPVDSFHQLIDEVATAAYVLTGRYHGALVALALGKPCEIIAQAEGDKLSSLKSLPFDRDGKRAEVLRGEEELRKALKNRTSQNSQGKQIAHDNDQR